MSAHRHIEALGVPPLLARSFDPVQDKDNAVPLFGRLLSKLLHAFRPLCNRGLEKSTPIDGTLPENKRKIITFILFTMRDFD